MNNELEALLERARGVTLTPEQLDEQRIQMAAANGQLADPRITVETVRATRTIMRQAEDVNPRM